jgi:hypothetical protein
VTLKEKNANLIKKRRTTHQKKIIMPTKEKKTFIQSKPKHKKNLIDNKLSKKKKIVKPKITKKQTTKKKVRSE